jgi:hypothetical protein
MKRGDNIMSVEFFTRAARLCATLALAVGAGHAAFAAPAGNQANTGAEKPAYEQVDKIPLLTHPYSWDVIDDQTVIIWATRYQPYLVKLAYKVPAHELRFAHVIGVTSYGSQVSAGVDSLRVDGLVYQIDSIHKLTKEEAQGLIGQS